MVALRRPIPLSYRPRAVQLTLRWDVPCLPAVDLEPDDEELLAANPRPQTRGECPEERPCPWVSCRYHLAIHVDSRGRIRAQPGVRDGDLEGLPFGGCSLDAAEAGPRSLLEVSQLLGTWKGDVLRLIRETLPALRALLEIGL